MLENICIDEKLITHRERVPHLILGQSDGHHQLPTELIANKAYSKQNSHYFGESLDRSQAKPEIRSNIW